MVRDLVYSGSARRHPGGRGLGTIAFLLMVPRAALATGTEGFLPSGRRIRNLLRGPVQEIAPTEPGVEAAPGMFAGFNLVSMVFVMMVTRADVWMMGLLLTNTTSESIMRQAGSPCR